jgi:predicted esterase
LWSASIALAEAGDPRSIPLLIGAIEADNSYDTVYGVGYFGLGFAELGKRTGVRYSPYHDGAWWRRWWDKNKSRFSEQAQSIPIAEFPKTKHGLQHIAFPEDLDTHRGRVRFATEQLKRPDVDLDDIAELFSEAGDPRGIPFLIGIIRSWPNHKADYRVGYFGLGRGKLGRLTKVPYDDSHDGLWWRAWWATHRRDFPTAADIPIPEFKVAAPAAPDPLADVADVPAADIKIDDDPKQRYFLIGDHSRKATPEDGFKLLVVMPGGDGGADFHPFVRRIYKHVLDESWLIAQPVSVRWTQDQEIVWPTKGDEVKGAKFTTEQFVEAVIADVKAKTEIDSQNVITLTWSSSGPAAYAVAFQPDRSVTASYIAMSVFRPQWYASMEAAKGHRFLLDHSPDDKVCPYELADLAEQTLTKLGAEVKRIDYRGGHGWRGDVYGRIRNGLAWLTE